MTLWLRPIPKFESNADPNEAGGPAAEPETVEDIKAKILGARPAGAMPWEVDEHAGAQPVAEPPPVAPQGTEVPLDETGMPTSPAEPGREEGEETPAPERGDKSAEGEGPPKDGKGGEVEPEAARDSAVDEMLSTLGHGPEQDAFRSLTKATGEGGDPSAWQEAVNSSFELGADGKPKLKLDAAARRMSEARGGEPETDFTMPTVDEDAIRKTIEAEERAFAEKHTDDTPAYMKAKKAQIDSRVSAEVKSAKEAQEAAIRRYTGRAATVSAQFFDANPDANKLETEIDSWFTPLPRKTVLDLLIQFPGILPRIYAAEKTRKNLRATLQDTFEKGREFERTKGKATDAGSPRTGGKAPRGADLSQGPDGGVKAGILSAGRKSVLGNLIPGE
jgi:hypothetical protein